MSINDDYYMTRRRDNERVAAAINSAWGADVAWVEDQHFDIPAKGNRHGYRGVLPVVKSRLVGGLLDGHPGWPSFFAGPAGGGMFK